MMKRLLKRLRTAMVARADRVLSTIPEDSGAVVLHDTEAIHQVVRKGDVILIEGRERLSQLIRLFTLSTWSHSVLYIGDAALKGDPEQKRQLIEKFGDQADRLVVEALIGGVVLSPLAKYDGYNVRICRPRDVAARNLETVLHSALSDLGKQYDRRNILHLALQLLPLGFGPFKKLSTEICIGACSEFQVICSGSIARAFQRVGVLVRPAPIGSYHPSWITPRDFDRSPNFEIIKA